MLGALVALRETRKFMSKFRFNRSSQYSSKHYAFSTLLTTLSSRVDLRIHSVLEENLNLS